MGGPCYLKYSAKGRKQPGPACTDNFQLKLFELEGVTYHSCEHAYQALKFPRGPYRDRVAALAPHAGESGQSHGMRCWSEGQRGLPRSHWERDKVGVMLAVNRAKYAQHADLRAELLATGRSEIVGGPSTGWRFLGKGHRWDEWNGRVQMMVREELRVGAVEPFAAPPEGAGALYAALAAHFGGYPEGRPGPPLPLHADGSTDVNDAGDRGGPGGKLESELASLAVFGLALPWACGACTFENASFPQMCEACDAPNLAHAAALTARRAAAAAGANIGAAGAAVFESNRAAAENADGPLGGGTQVTPLVWSPHLREVSAAALPPSLSLLSPCEECGVVGDVCLALGDHRVLCGRYANGCMLQHAARPATRCKLALSFADLSVWDYTQNAYLDFYRLAELQPAYQFMHRLKFGEDAALPVPPLLPPTPTLLPLDDGVRPTAAGVVVCVGDLHGCLAEAQSLWANLERHLGGAARLAAATVVFLGDYVDRGPDSKAVLDWLVNLKAKRAAEAEAAGSGGGSSGGTYFLCGNHDFAFGAFLGDDALPAGRPHTRAELDASVRADFTDGFYYDEAGAAALAKANAESGRLEAAPGKVGARPSDGADMHYQGRRWGGSGVYDSDATVQSYGAGPGNFSPAARQRLQAAVPAAHKRFLKELAWCADLAVPFAPGRLVAVHAGLAHGGVGSAERQLAALKARDFTDPALHTAGEGGGSGCAGRDPGRLEPLSGRHAVRAQHPDFAGGQCLLVSGHHHTVALEGDDGCRLVVDKCGGEPGPRAPLQALLLPSRELVSSSVAYPEQKIPRRLR